MEYVQVESRKPSTKMLAIDGNDMVAYVNSDNDISPAGI